MKSQSKKSVDYLLGSAKLRRTGPRAAVLTVLLNNSKPQTAHQIAAKLANNTPNRVTIYRILQKLVLKGVVHRAYTKERTWFYEPVDHCTENQCHPHFTCTICNDTHCLTEITMPMAKSPYKGFIINHQKVQLDGLCPSCTAQRHYHKQP